MGLDEMMKKIVVEIHPHDSEAVTSQVLKGDQTTLVILKDMGRCGVCSHPWGCHYVLYDASFDGCLGEDDSILCECMGYTPR